MFVPNEKRVYGSAVVRVNTVVNGGQACGQFGNPTEKFSQVIDITKTRIKAMDKPTQPCSHGNEKIDTSACTNI